jgi:O-succinylbenzoic acid--CoA ligase
MNLVDPYHFKTIILNGKEISLKEILLGNISPQSEFEQHTLNFIKEWLTGAKIFSIKTSGSTGIPKILNITREQMIHSAVMTITALGLKKGDTALVCLNTQFIAGRMMLVRSLVGQMKIVALDPSSNPLSNNVQRFDFIALVPLQLQAILYSENKNRLDYIKAILIGGARVDESQLKTIKTIKSPIYATYGMTETISHIALQKINEQPEESYFTTLPGIKINTDQRGCLVINAPYLYDTVITNDLVKVHSDKTFSWIGRWDNVINTGGIKVSPEKIECEIQQIMDSLKMNQTFLVSGISDHVLGEKIILIIEGKTDKKNWGKILTLCKQTFSKYEIPKEIFTLEKFIYTKNEKIDRKATLRATMAQDFRNMEH